MLKAIQSYRFLLWCWLIFLGLNLGSRLGLLATFGHGFDAESVQVLLYGLRMDTIVFSAFALFFALFYAAGWRLWLRVSLAAFALLVVYLEISTFFFFDQFSSRPNYLFVEHFKNSKEILQMIWGLYPLAVLLVVPLLAWLSVAVFQYSQRLRISGQVKARWQVFPLIVVVLFLGMRSSLDASTPNQSFYTFSQDNTNNELANNTIFSILYAWHWAENEHFADYGQLQESEVLQRVRQQSGFLAQDKLIHQQISSFSGKKNVILVILESFGHDHVGYLGGTPTTPHLDALAAQGLRFDKMYAAGNRTAWGVSSLLTGLYPLPNREYVKALKSQQHFYTIAQSFRQHGYHNAFLYAGDADFDNMRAFMLSNGFDEVMGKEVFDPALTTHTWGYADEDLYDKAVSLIAQQSQPYFLTVLTLSSHEPFDYPAGKTALYAEAPVRGFANSIKYADYALGKFYQTLQDKGLLKNTVVAFIADHSNNAYGPQDVPVERYHIAAVLMDEAFQDGQVYAPIASQIDFGPTLLDVAGLDVIVPSMGVSVFQQQRDSALLLYQQRYAYLRPDGFVVYQDKQPAKAYAYDYHPQTLSAEDEKNGLAYLLAPHLLYEQGAYPLPDPSISAAFIATKP